MSEHTALPGEREGGRGAPDEGVLRGGFRLLFAGDAISTLGTSISALALQILLIETLHADQQEIGLVRGAQFAPYIIFGLLAGVIADRMRRRPLLIGTDLLGLAIFAAIGGLALAGRLTVPMLAGLVFVFGAVSCLAVAAYQSYIPRLVPERALPAAFARLEQLSQTAGAVGPLAAGALLRWVSAPVAILLDAISYAVSACFLLAIRTPEPAADRGERRHIVAELREGARWVYRHETLRPYALWLHAWFVGHALVTTVLVYYATVDLELSPLAVGLGLACAGVSGALAAGLAPRLSRRFGLGRVFAAVELVSPTWPLIIVFARPGAWALVLLVVTQLLDGLTSVSGSLGMSYRSAVTPDRLRARMNATIRTFNWGGLAIASMVSGVIAATWGTRAALLVGAAVLTVATAYLWRSPYRGAVMPAPD